MATMLPSDASGGARKRDQAEHGLSYWLDKFMDRCFLGAAPGPCWYTAIESGTWMPGASEQQRMNAETKRRARGIKPYHLDWYAWQFATGHYVQWELKVEGRRTRSGQDATLAALRREGISTGVFETVPAVCEFLHKAGFHLRENARYVAAELHERYLAKRREHAVPVKPKRAARATGKASTVSVAQAHRMGLWK